MDIVIDSINKHNYELQQQIWDNERSKHFLHKFKLKLDVLENNCSSYDDKLSIQNTIDLIKNECDSILSEKDLYYTKFGIEIYKKAVEYADTLFHKLETRLVDIDSLDAQFLGTFSLGIKDEKVNLSIDDHKELNQLHLHHNDLHENNNTQSISKLQQEILKLYYKKKYGDSHKCMKDIDVYNSKHFNKWFNNASKRPTRYIKPDLENEYDLRQYYENRFNDKYKRKKDTNIFESYHFKNWIKNKQKLLTGVNNELIKRYSK
jgi:hypothetical protein|uniref:Uncharacterized protein n=1 Tax=viral metagenome TaxID=1070528 RepID=A0A6C0BR14_9ZZZZ